MIQFKRGKTSTWEKQKTVLADGQPGYDKERKKLKIGNGKDSWDKLPDASGLFMDEIIDSEENAKKKAKVKAALNPLANFVAGLLKKDDRPVITYGTETPDDETVGQVYLQHYEAAPEVDYVVEYGLNGIWSYQIWKSGFATCSGTMTLKTSVKEPIGDGHFFINDSKMTKISYPFKFKETKIENVEVFPSESVSLVGNKLAWIAASESNSFSTTGKYSIISVDKQPSDVYQIVFKVEGYADR